MIYVIYIRSSAFKPLNYYQQRLERRMAYWCICDEEWMMTLVLYCGICYDSPHLWNFTNLIVNYELKIGSQIMFLCDMRRSSRIVCRMKPPPRLASSFSFNHKSHFYVTVCSNDDVNVTTTCNWDSWHLHDKLFSVLFMFSQC